MAVHYTAPPLETRAETLRADTGSVPRATQARGNPAGWVTADDYPAGALRDGRQGTVALRFTVTVDGRVTDCRIVKSSGSPLLDNTSCGLVEERGRYYPARDAAGRAVAESKTLRFTWRMPD